MHRVLTNHQLILLQSIIEHLSSKKDRQITITEFLDSCQYNKIIDLILERIDMVEKYRFEIINDQIKNKMEKGTKGKILVKPREK